MDSIVNKLTEIEDAASAIVQHAEKQKEDLDREYDEKKRKFDSELEADTRKRIHEIQDSLQKETSKIMDSQNGKASAAIDALRREYEEKHTEYAREILRRITEV